MSIESCLDALWGKYLECFSTDGFTDTSGYELAYFKINGVGETCYFLECTKTGRDTRPYTADEMGKVLIYCINNGIDLLGDDL